MPTVETENTHESPRLPAFAGSGDSGRTPKLNVALAQFQKRLPEIPKNAVGGRRNKYASLDVVAKAVLPKLGEHGLAFVSWSEVTPDGTMFCYALVHDSGEERGGRLPLGRPADAQALGSLLTYYRRYTLCAMTGVWPEDEDDDGQAAMPKPDPVRPVESLRTPDKPKQPKPPAAASPLPQKLANLAGDMAFRAEAGEQVEVDDLRVKVHEEAAKARLLSAMVGDPFASPPWSVEVKLSVVIAEAKARIQAAGGNSG